MLNGEDNLGGIQKIGQWDGKTTARATWQRSRLLHGLEGKEWNPQAGLAVQVLRTLGRSLGTASHHLSYEMQWQPLEEFSRQDF